MNTLGYGTSVFGKIPLDGRFGRRTRRGVKEFQHAEGLVEDGVFGPVVARKLFHPLITGVAETEEIPANILWGMTSQESLFDPGAVSSRYKLERGPDLGLCQINIRSNPQFTASQAFRPRQALTWSAQNYHEALRQFQWGGPELQVNCAIANHNSPVQARKWYDDGVPPSEQIADYVADVLTAAETY
jgi:peptidoglycan hydrolase-like protein with peptidoglycan-binding domain